MALDKITTTMITDAAVTAAKVATDVATQAELDAIPVFDDDTIQTNLAVLAFKTATTGSLAKYNLKDQIVDEFVDATGIDGTPSTNHVLLAGVYKGEAVAAGNYFGDDSDGTVTTTANVTHTVQNKNGTYDGDMLVKNYTDLTIASGHTMTVDQNCRGMLIYCSGNCTIAGTLTMTGKGAFANPESSGGSDSNAVQAAGLQLGFKTTGGSTSLTNANTNFNGCGTAARTSIANFADTSSNGTTITVPRSGSAGANGPPDTQGTPGVGGNDAANATGGATGGGGSGGGYLQTSGLGTKPYIFSGAKGSCFVGGSGGGGMGGSNGRNDAYVDATAATDWGGPGGNGGGSNEHGGFGFAGGSGNPGGDGFCAGTTHCSHDTYWGTGSLISQVTRPNFYGGGGLIWLIVKGNLTVTGTVSANGNLPNGEEDSRGFGSGSSGGGAIVYAYAGTLSIGSGTIEAAGGVAQVSVEYGSPRFEGGEGGDGSVQALAVLSNSAPYSDLTLQSLDTTAETEPDYADMVMLMEDTAGTATVNTDIKGYISEDSGVTFTQGTLVDEGDWGTNKRILAFHDLDISAQTGTAMCYKITTHNQSVSKETKIHATSIGWR